MIKYYTPIMINPLTNNKFRYCFFYEGKNIVGKVKIEQKMRSVFYTTPYSKGDIISYALCNGWQIARG